ncbi:MAG: hypothetical protein K8I02_08960, partial [Candidatus Methylomirabilis sp.]|nr:hypothetical protein [Deltaproteobacteria bacterium]
MALSRNDAIAAVLCLLALSIASPPPARAQHVIEIPSSRQRMTPAADRARKEEALLKGVVWLGRGAVLLQHDRVVYFNPFNLREPYKDGDLVLITDPRPEHCSLRDVERALKPEGVVLTVRECAEKLGLGERAETPAPGERLIRRGLVIETLPAYL